MNLGYILESTRGLDYCQTMEIWDQGECVLFCLIAIKDITKMEPRSSFPRRREPRNIAFCVRFAFLLNVQWIPACAGMTIVNKGTADPATRDSLWPH